MGCAAGARRRAHRSRARERTHGGGARTRGRHRPRAHPRDQRRTHARRRRWRCGGRRGWRRRVRLRWRDVNRGHRRAASSQRRRRRSRRRRHCPRARRRRRGRGVAAGVDADLAVFVVVVDRRRRQRGGRTVTGSGNGSWSGGRRVDGSAAQQAAHPFHHRVRLPRLRQLAVGARLLPARVVVRLLRRRQDVDRHRAQGGVSLDRRTQVVPRAARHHAVGDDQVRMSSLRKRQPLIRRTRARDGHIVGAGERHGERFLDRHAVVGDQDAFGHLTSELSSSP